MPDGHRDRILDQFTRQAAPFSRAPGLTDEATLDLVVRFSEAGSNDTVLDVACGPGILACAFARRACHVTGIDMTPAMLDHARALARDLGLVNVTWINGDVPPLPFRDGSFSIVCSRFAFHHFLDPLAVLLDMARVCTPGGQVVVVDTAPARAKAEAFNRMETLRDPSHVRAAPIDELRTLFASAGLPAPRETAYRLEGDLDALLGRSFPAPGGAGRIRALFEASLDDDALDVAPRRRDGRIVYGFPVAVLASRRV